MNDTQGDAHGFRAECRGFAYGTAGGQGDAEKNEDLMARTRRLAQDLMR